MATEKDYQDLYDRIAALQAEMAKRLESQILTNPPLADVLNRNVDDMLDSVVAADEAVPPPNDLGLAGLIGIGQDAEAGLGDTRVPYGVEPYDETVTSERILAVADLYYIYQHERIGVFRVVQKLQELFRAGAVRLSSGPGAFALYRFDRREVLRYTNEERQSAYKRSFGYGAGPVTKGGRSNEYFHHNFTHFVNQVALYWRDKRISDVMRERAYDPSFGSVAVVRRAGLDLRNNMKFTSYGHLNVLRVEVMQLLDEAFRILNAEDIKRLTGADTAWDVIEDVLSQHFNERLVTSPRQRMAVAGRELFRWLAQPHILQSSRTEFETLLLNIAEYAEEWLTSAQSIGVAKRMPTDRVLPFDYARNNDDGMSAGERAPLARAAVRPRPPFGSPRARTGGMNGNPQRRVRRAVRPGAREDEI
jgi:hypothetical protein